MSRPWPDEVRAMVDALMPGGACPAVVPIADDGGWRVYANKTHADYDPHGKQWKFGATTMNAAAAQALLLSDRLAVDPRYVLSDRILAAVPGALVTTTTDGIEVSVGSKSVRWKREQRGWSMDDDLFTSDEGVIESMRAMAVEAEKRAEASAAAIALADRLRAKYPDAKIETAQTADGWSVVGESAGFGFRTTYANGKWQWYSDHHDENDIIQQIARDFDRVAPAYVVALCRKITHEMPGLSLLAERDSNGYWCIRDKEPFAQKSFCTRHDGWKWTWEGRQKSEDEIVALIREWLSSPPLLAPIPLIDRLREAVPGLEWYEHNDEISADSGKHLRAVVVGTKLLCWLSNHGEPHAVDIARPSDDQVVRIVTEWCAKTHAAPQPSPRAQALLDALRAQGYEPTYKRHDDGVYESVFCESEHCRAHQGEPRWWYLGAEAGTEYVAEQMHLRIARRRERTVEATQATASKRSPRELAAHELAARFQREFPDATVGFAGDGSRVWVEQYSERVEWEQTVTGRWARPGGTAFASDWAVYSTRRSLDEAAKRRGYAVPMSANILDTDALTRAIEEHTKREKAHAAKGPTMTTKTQALTQTIKLDASEAAWRTAGSQFVKLAREPLVGLLTRHLAPNDDAFRARLAAFLETELGTALLASMLSATLSALPQTTGEVPQKLARELRVKAMATAGDELASVLSGPLLQVMRLYLQDPAGAPAAPALDEPQHAPASVDWSTAREVSR